ncbi:diguanylate cyclase [Moraxellaceae bacterium AER2_44_116]|nr:diguanylate cyclase [Moraxellaceae bacterium]TQC98047.1 diguanylate cyclase [Moraxellaceae bacterium AER2_44_116]
MSITFIKSFFDTYRLSFLEIWQDLFTKYAIKNKPEYAQYLSKKIHHRIIFSAPMLVLLFSVKLTLYFFSLSLEQFLLFFLIEFSLIDGSLLAMLISSVFTKNLNESYYKNMFALASFSLLSCVLVSIYCATQHIYFPYEIVGMSVLLFLWIFNTPFKWIFIIPFIALIMYFSLTIPLNHHPTRENITAIIALTISFMIGLFYSTMNSANEYQLYQSFRDAEAQAMTDMMTNLYNRNGFMHHFEQHKKIAQREKKSIYIAILDIDNFKRVNDNYGHDIGDNVIVMVATKLTELYRRPLDLVARWGGEEFIVSWCEDNPQAIPIMGKKICQTIANSVIISPSKQLSVTVSIGIAQLNDNDTSFSEALKRADTALYFAKNNGKNQYSVA